MDVMVAIVEDIETAPGSVAKPGEILTVGSLLAAQWVSNGKAVYYSDFRPEMIRTRQVRVLEEPSNAAASTEAPRSGRRKASE